ncbi:Uncharacterised protein [Mycobacteroides abscessus subsp. abscessus]|nr:Uncharacterised protein [Mycobacteroides abscessus subsp. abscessus]SHV25367.1 Uncharacterised protein [Mycobacteroides abscessus subsp. abscessus]SIH50130.1 Uncharacterised protein [Mycobacteroides abscessus subsp. abscessus]SLJ07647.1 Uncharacterised protein [Mycobacteroides abscessus subsp. abscessus]
MIPSFGSVTLPVRSSQMYWRVNFTPEASVISAANLASDISDLPTLSISCVSFSAKLSIPTPVT